MTVPVRREAIGGFPKLTTQKPPNGHSNQSIQISYQKQKPTKAATKGQKQIFQENKSTIRFYTLMSSASMVPIVKPLAGLFVRFRSISFDFVERRLSNAKVY